jgi:hypothetical protein
MPLISGIGNQNNGLGSSMNNGLEVRIKRAVKVFVVANI